jgi:hypothetical protein
MKLFRFAEFGPPLVLQIEEVASRTWRGKKHLISHLTEAGRQEA